NWAVLGCGNIANDFARDVTGQGGKIYSVANRTYEKAVGFAEKYNIEKVYENTDDLFVDENVDIVYIATPHNKHIEYILKALENGKHMLCEKAITLNSQELKKAVKLANKKNLILAEAMTIYNMPLYTELEKIINSGDLGEFRLAQVNFGSFKEYDMTNRFFNMDLAGGALLDIGVYALSLVRMFMETENAEIHSQVKFAPTGADEQSSIIIENEKEQMASVTLSLHAKQPKRATICYDNAYIEIFEYPRADKATITYTNDGHTQEIVSGKLENALCYELQNMENAVETGKNTMRLDYTIDVMNIMTKLRNDWNMKYPEEM
ncbi:MAG: Gfo/Idh/MocA family oxidoreductase, partial [Clostridia bacterium]|nr:Gfo/Idh/MocA family oxidoreductase [Clostridia bacterium]